MRVVNNITQLIGQTPMVKLNRVVPEGAAEIYAKLESFNPGGSVKDRIALNMIESAEAEGVLKAGGTIIEPTSGNTGIGLAMVGAAKGYKVILTMPDTMSIERRKILKAFGAEILLTPGEKGMPGAIDKAKELADANDDYFMPQQFMNAANPDVHRKTTAKEIIEATAGKLDAFVAGIGTGGTVTGTGEVLKEEISGIKIVGIEPTGSPVISGGNPGPHMIQGIGAGFIPDVLNTDILDEVKQIENEEAMEMARKLAVEEGILVGISAGAAVAAAIKVAQELGADKRVVVIIPDTGERYLSTTLFKAE
ncbi:cysteine synthase A [Orenia metallireducens]|uniref:Cysteine synthase n=1 Tax=Orenia metallireducens TaxID=1413210 RepID=A0A285GD78_9FIRM|nr:cysteine synthase A [Orenia metallireducens]PRX32481.1 cysteine synthase A [Orenia metallireducens]SNY21124.1 cysteine synthase A [Orenia metallireducens]